MSGTGRWFVSIPVFAAAFFFSYWLVFVQIIPENLPWLGGSCCAFDGNGPRRRGLDGVGRRLPSCFLPTMLTCSTVVGAIGFSGGFFGPMIFTPDANQGPLLGLFITGPLRMRRGRPRWPDFQSLASFTC